MTRPRRCALPAALLAAALIAACGSSGLTTAQIRARATTICEAASDRTERIHIPAAPAGGQHFLAQGIAVLAPELRALHALGHRGELQIAVTAMEAQLTALRSSLKGLRSGNDPVVAIKTLQQQLLGPESRANAAWRALKVPACVSR